MDSIGICSTLLLSVLLTTVNGQQSVVSVPTIQGGGSFRVYCDASRVTIPVASVTSIVTLTLARQVGTAQSFTTIAQYKIYGTPALATTIPSGRGWNITGTGANGGTNNRNTMKIEMLVPDAQCTDAGLYKCTVRYTSPTDNIDYDQESTPQNVTALAGISAFTFSLNPDFSIGNTADYYAGTYLEMKCRVNGPQGLTFAWMVRSAGGFSFTDYYQQNDITTSPATPITGSTCNQYYHESVLAFNVTELNDGYTYKCEIRQNAVAVESDNVTIGIATTPDSGAASAGNSDPDVGMIVGIVIGVLAFIAIIVIVVVIVMKKRKSSGGDKYANNEAHDAPSDPNLHAPPPVFYSKPSKPPKDEKDNTVPAGMTNEALDTSYDSKDSANRGPPRYANTDADVSGPPRYEKESHRGRHNRGYNEEDHDRDRDRDRNGGHGRRNPRDERRSRSRDADDEPRSRHYSTEDGTDDRGYSGFGDPSIGTAI